MCIIFNYAMVLSLICCIWCKVYTFYKNTYTYVDILDFLIKISDALMRSVSTKKKNVSLSLDSILLVK